MLLLDQCIKQLLLVALARYVGTVLGEVSALVILQKYYYCASMQVMTVIILIIALSLINHNYSSHQVFWFVIFKH